MYLYIVECSDKSYYTGVYRNLDYRLYEHNSGSNPKAYTFKRRPVVLKYQSYFSNPNDAIAAEKQFKGWSRAKKEALMNDDWDLIKELAKSKNDPSRNNT
jgi:putative endonuclease